MDNLVSIITLAGRSAAMNADLAGAKINITEIGVGDVGYTPTENATSLSHELMRVPIASATRYPDEARVRVNSVLDGAEEFYVREIGWYLEDGSLFAVWSHPTLSLGFKSALNRMVFGLSLELSSVNPEVIEVVDAGVALELSLAEELAQVGTVLADIQRKLLACTNFEEFLKLKNSFTQLEKRSAGLFSEIGKKLGQLDQGNSRLKSDISQLKQTHEADIALLSEEKSSVASMAVLVTSMTDINRRFLEEKLV